MKTGEKNLPRFDHGRWSNLQDFEIILEYFTTSLVFSFRVIGKYRKSGSASVWRMLEKHTKRLHRVTVRKLYLKSEKCSRDPRRQHTYSALPRSCGQQLHTNPIFHVAHLTMDQEAGSPSQIFEIFNFNSKKKYILYYYCNI